MFVPAVVTRATNDTDATNATNATIRTPMHKGRLEAFSDGVIAIILTIMVLDLKVPKDHSLAGLLQLWPIWLAYVLSYYNVLVLWANHHEALARVDRIDRTGLFANGTFLFCMSLIPFATAYAGEEHWSEPLPVVLYGVVMLLVSVSFGRLRMKLAGHCDNAAAAEVNRRSAKAGFRRAVLFFAGAAAALAHPRLGLVFFVAIPLGVGLYRRSVLPD